MASQLFELLEYAGEAVKAFSTPTIVFELLPEVTQKQI